MLLKSIFSQQILALMICVHRSMGLPITWVGFLIHHTHPLLLMRQIPVVLSCPQCSVLWGWRCLSLMDLTQTGGFFELRSSLISTVHRKLFVCGLFLFIWKDARQRGINGWKWTACWQPGKNFCRTLNIILVPPSMKILKEICLSYPKPQQWQNFRPLLKI